MKGSTLYALNRTTGPPAQLLASGMLTYSFTSAKLRPLTHAYSSRVHDPLSRCPRRCHNLQDETLDGMERCANGSRGSAISV